MKRPVLVYGSGLIARTIAFELACRGASVVLAVRERLGAATPAAGGMLAPSGEIERVDAAFFEDLRAALDLWPEFADRLRTASGAEVPLGSNGTLFAALHADHLRELDRQRSLLTRAGIAAAVLNQDEVRALEPALTSRVLAGLWVEAEGSTDPRTVFHALQVAGRRAGIIERAATDLRIEDVASEAPRVTERDGMAFPVAHLVVADGAFSAELLPALNDLRPVKGQYAILQGPPLLERVVQTKDIYLVPREDGRIYLGASMEEVGFQHGNTPREIARLFHEAWRLLPETQELAIAEIGYGFRPALRTFGPRLAPIGPHATLAVGHYRHGVLLAPWTAARVAERLNGL